MEPALRALLGPGCETLVIVGGDGTAGATLSALVRVTGAKIEPSVKDDPPGTRYQFERTGYFMSDPVDSKPGALVFNRTVTLRDTWKKRQK